MNRTIKFRAWDKKRKRMYDNIFSIEWGTGKIYVMEGEKLMPIGIFLANVELLEFTGIKDKYEKEIYEGDLIKAGNSVTKIYYHEKSASFQMGLSDHVLDQEICRYDGIEIIGNIYEGCDKCKAQPNKTIAVDDVKRPKCSNCGKDLLK